MDTLTRKEKKFVKEYVKNEGNGTQAALKAYDTKSQNAAAVIASRELRKDKVQSAIQEALPDELLAQIHREGLFATKTIFKNNNSTGEIEAVAEEADFAVRHKYLDSAYKIKGAYAPEKHANVNVNIEAEPGDIDLDALITNAEAALKAQKLNG